MRPPAQVLSSALAASPAAVWSRLQHSAFLADYLGAALPEATWAVGLSLAGTGASGAALRLTLLRAQAPVQMTFALQQASGDEHLLLSIEPAGQGSRLTVLHGPAEPADRPHALSWADAGAAPAVGPAAALAAGLALALDPALLSGRPGSFDSDAARQQAWRYLSDTAALVARLRLQMGDRQGYAQATAGAFSLAQHLWHLADVEQFGWASRFQRLLREVAPVLPGVDGDRLALERRYQQRPWRAAARRFEAQRHRTLLALARCDAAVLRRPVQFSGQPATGAEMLAALLAHDHEHRVEMAALWPPSAAPRAARTRPSPSPSPRSRTPSASAMRPGTP